VLGACECARSARLLARLMSKPITLEAFGSQGYSLRPPPREASPPLRPASLARSGSSAKLPPPDSEPPLGSSRFATLATSLAGTLRVLGEVAA
jgi:hypothetical protein